ncbi:hypothetical protein EAE91_14450 [Photorhabdus noenieputensis]|uniref:hypothetical protein n=1 Tax=Photorhabdus noenieputensis TaxID=1208607 RepID=UPI001BD3916E|nr:hypothetical protein [Photorhabdus noenieputensis]MBS9438304.1 hypothetical protein [Photorhabdus noenieputensis]MCK3669836.1 hypothetical protein [Photorhabdus noenieputensis]
MVVWRDVMEDEFLSILWVVPYGMLISRVVLVISIVLFTVCGLLLGNKVRYSRYPRMLLAYWCRTWILPLLFIAIGLVLMFGVDGEGWLGRILDKLDSVLMGLFLEHQHDVSPALYPATSFDSGLLWGGGG